MNEDTLENAKCFRCLVFGMSYHKFILNGQTFEFELNTKTHRWVVWIRGEPFEYSKAKGQAIIDFLSKVNDFP